LNNKEWGQLMKGAMLRGLAASVVAGLLVVLIGCVSLPRGTTKVFHVGALVLHAKGAGLVTADTETTTYQIKCGRCGLETGKMVVDTPSVGHPYTRDWTCPKCRRTQSLVIEASGL
jgi:hypothetical protein